MRRTNLTKTAVLCLSLMPTVLTTVVFAQGKPDYFVGSWDVVIEGIPEGDVKMIIDFERKDGKLLGVIKRPESDKAVSIINSITEHENYIMGYFYAEGHDVHMKIQKSGENSVTGSLLDTFNVKGQRVLKKEE